VRKPTCAPARLPLGRGQPKKQVNFHYTVLTAHATHFGLVEPNDKAVFVSVLQGEEYSGLRLQTEDETVISRLFPELVVDLAEVFA
jgi:hypothetical protein